jgi:hypothetical protein
MSPLRRLARAIFSSDGDEPPREEPVPLVVVDNEPTAELWRGILEDNGIPCMLRNRAALAHLRGLPFGRWELLVRQGDLERAKGVLGVR